MAIQSRDERVRASRISVQVRVECKTPQNYVIAHCENISEAGMLVKAKQTFEVSQMVTLLFVLPPGTSGKLIQAGGIVVREQKDESMAVKFVGLRPLFRETIAKYIAGA